MLYHPISNELDLTSLMDDYDKNFYLPKVVDDALEVRPFKVGDRLVAGHFNVLEPLTEAVEPEILDIVFIPALMVDSKKQRLGYGKGYYDRFLPNLSDKCKTIVAISSKLLIQEIPSEEFDIPVDFVVTD
jgi:5-formyltetrahydrofolate cyclo-ligase